MCTGVVLLGRGGTPRAAPEVCPAHPTAAEQEGLSVRTLASTCPSSVFDAGLLVGVTCWLV